MCQFQQLQLVHKTSGLNLCVWDPKLQKRPSDHLQCCPLPSLTPRNQKSGRRFFHLYWMETENLNQFVWLKTPLTWGFSHWLCKMSQTDLPLLIVKRTRDDVRTASYKFDAGRLLDLLLPCKLALQNGNAALSQGPHSYTV